MKTNKLIKIIACGQAFSMFPTLLYGSELVYEVQAGDTLGHIAERYAIENPQLNYRQTLKLFKKINSNNNKFFDRILPGQKLLVPSPQDIRQHLNGHQGFQVPKSSPKRIYQVKKGDTLSEIAKAEISEKFDDVPNWQQALELILGLNPHIDNPDVIYVGQKIYLPIPKSQPAHYKVKPGDTLSEVSQELVLAGQYPEKKRAELQRQILSLNPEMPNPDLIFPDQELLLPEDQGSLEFSNITPREVASQKEEAGKEEGKLKFQNLPKKPIDPVLKQYL